KPLGHPSGVEADVRVRQPPRKRRENSRRGGGQGKEKPEQARGERGSGLSDVHLERGPEGGLRDIYPPELAHPVLALLLLLHQRAPRGYAAAIAFGGDIFAQRTDRLAGDHAAPNRGLDRDLEKLPRNQIFQLLADRTAALLGLAAMGDETERVDRVLVHQDGNAHQIALGVAVHLVVEAGVAAADGFQAVVEVEHHLVQREAVYRHGPVADVSEVYLLTAPLAA